MFKSDLYASAGAACLIAALSIAGMRAASAQDLKSGEQVYQETCATCHAAGVASAPKFGDKAAWKKLLGEGQIHVTTDAWIGEGGMPAKGGRADLKLEEFARAVAFMARAGGGTWKDPDAKLLSRIAEQEKKIRAANSKKK